MQWNISQELVTYDNAIETMEQRVANIHTGTADELVWFVEHPPLYTAGTNANASDVLDEERFPIFQTGRGGQYTYHGPGQRVVYVMLDLKKRAEAKGESPDLRAYVSDLERWMINTLARFEVIGETREGRVGVWVEVEENSEKKQERDQQAEPLVAEHTSEGGVRLTRLGEAGASLRRSLVAESRRTQQEQYKKAEKKIGAIGVRVRKWVTYHGLSLNVNPDLSHYQGIVPCGISEFGVTSLSDLGIDVTIHEVDTMLKQEFEKVFGNSNG